MAFGGTELTGGATAGQVSPATFLGSVSITSTTLSIPPGGFDVSAFESIIIVVNLTNGTGGHVLVGPTWSDSGNNLIGPQLGSSNSMLVFSGGILTACYRNLGPFVSVGVIPSGVSGPMTATVFGCNTKPRFDGPYTPGVQGEILAQSDSLGAGLSLGLAGYCGPALCSVASFTANTFVQLEYEDIAGLFHSYAIIGTTASNALSREPTIWVPAAPGKVVNNGAAAVPVAVIAA